MTRTRGWEEQPSLHGESKSALAAVTLKALAQARECKSARGQCRGIKINDRQLLQLQMLTDLQPDGWESSVFMEFFFFFLIFWSISLQGH